MSPPPPEPYPDVAEGGRTTLWPLQRLQTSDRALRVAYEADCRRLRRVDHHALANGQPLAVSGTPPEVGATAQFTATATMSTGGSQSVTNLASWRWSGGSCSRSGRRRSGSSPSGSVIAVLLMLPVRHKAYRVPTQTVADASPNQNDKRYEDEPEARIKRTWGHQEYNRGRYRAGLEFQRHCGGGKRQESGRHEHQQHRMRVARLTQTDHETSGGEREVGHGQHAITPRHNTQPIGGGQDCPIGPNHRVGERPIQRFPVAKYDSATDPPHEESAHCRGLVSADFCERGHDRRQKVWPPKAKGRRTRLN